MVTSQPKAYGRREHRVCCRRAWRDRAAAVYAATAAYTGSQPPVVDNSNVGSSISASTPSSSCNIDISATPLSKKMKLIQKHTVSSQSPRSQTPRPDKGVRCEPEGEDDDPLSFWRSNSSKFSLLRELRGQGHAESERVFSSGRKHVFHYGAFVKWKTICCKPSSASCKLVVVHSR